MAVVKSFSVGDGDMFYIRHYSDSFTVIDCCNYVDGRTIDEELFFTHLEEIKKQSRAKSVTRFISTHPDEDHISGLCTYRDKVGIVNFYCVANETTKENESNDFKEYRSLRDGKKAFYLRKGCLRKWLNLDSDESDNDNRKSSGISCLWPDEHNDNYKAALQVAKEGGSPNNISPILTYSAGDIKFMWMGDIEGGFLDKVKGSIDFSSATILFAPHHGRASGKISEDILSQLNPRLIVVGEAPSTELNYYNNYNTITQNSARDIVFKTCTGGVNIYVGNINYSVDYLHNSGCDDDYGCHYIGTLCL